MLAVTVWGWGWLGIAGAAAVLETVALVQNKNGTLSRVLRVVTAGGKRWVAVGAWVVFAVWFPLHLWVFAPAAPLLTAAPAVGATAAGACHGTVLPDHACTPGAIDPRVTQANIHQTICVPGYTRKVRPSVAVTGRIKTERMTAYGFRGAPGLYELDHLVSLELGGAPVDVKNLWPEPYAGVQGAHAKDVVENRLHAEVCAGTVPLAKAQAEIAGDWRTAP